MNALSSCDVGVLFALGQESGCFEDKLVGKSSVKGEGFSVLQGTLHGRRVVTMRTGPGQKNAFCALEMLLQGHRPQKIISAGFAGALSPELKRFQLFLPEAVSLESGEKIVLANDLSQNRLTETLGAGGVPSGMLLTVDRIVRSPAERSVLQEKCFADAVDMETFSVAKHCQAGHIPFLAVRAILDTADEELSPDIERIMDQKSEPARWGAALGVLLRRPLRFKELWSLKEKSLEASSILADALERVISVEG